MDTVTILNHKIHIWILVAAGAGLLLLVLLTILLFWLLRRRRRRRKRRALQSRPFSMESFAAGHEEVDSDELDDPTAAEPFVVISNTRKERGDRLIKEIALITDEGYRDGHSPTTSQDFESVTTSTLYDHSPSKSSFSSSTHLTKQPSLDQLTAKISDNHFPYRPPSR